MTFLYSAARREHNIIVTAQKDGRTQTLLILQTNSHGHLVARDHQLLEITPPHRGTPETITLIDSPEHDAAGILEAIAGCLPRRVNVALQLWLTALLVLLALIILSLFLPHSRPVPVQESAMTRSLSPELVPEQENLPVPVPSAVKSGIKPATPEPDGKIPAVMEQQRERLPLTLNSVFPDKPSAALTPAQSEEAHPVATVPEGAENDKSVEDVENAEASAARKNLATVLKRNADRGMFTITLSSGHERTLYAFLDPRCPNCRALEPVLRRLATDFSIVVYPVSVIGGEASASHVAPLLCEKDPQKRAEGWHHLYSADDGMVTPGLRENTPPDEECLKAARAAIDVNNVAFRQFGFPGTPWVLSDTGWHLPATLLQEPGKVSLFLKTINDREKEHE
ncbi:DsbC family protein [Salmonella enterica subsp. enterica serovar Stanley]|nr:DsbC family protein [Salmonella enterica subsp. enterica serovar Stanley]